MLELTAMRKRAVTQRLLTIVLTLLSIVLVISVTNFYKIMVQEAFASSSPSFQRQELTLGSGNWFDMFRNKSTSSGPNYIDIESVSYFSNGRHLNATLWLANFTIAPTDYEDVNYGMYFDADSNNRTGSGGIDYKVEINWNSERRTWERILEEWSSSGHSKTLDKKENTTDFFGRGGSYVTLYADLDSMLSPDNYRIIFYAEVIDLKKRLNWIIDSTDWISIPSPELILEVLPSPIPLTQGGNSIAELRINSSTADGLDIHLGTPTVHGTNTTNVNIILGSEKLHIPPFGVVSTQLRVSVPFGIETAAYTITIPVTITPVYSPLNLGFGPTLPSPSENGLLSSSSSQSVSAKKGQALALAANDETISKSVAFSVQVMAFHEQLNSFINQWVTPLTAIYASISSIIGGILAWIYERRRRRRRKSKKYDQNNNNNKNNNINRKDH
jgi:hypothetical protein